MKEFDGSRTYSYRVGVEWAPMYELVMSVHAFANARDRAILEAGDGWVKATRAQLSHALLAELAHPSSDERRSHLSWWDLLVHLCPGERDVAGFLGWLASMSAGEIYERLAPHAGPGHKALPRDAGALRDRAVWLIAEWNEQYFRRLNPAILESLDAAARAARALASTMGSAALVEDLTNGVQFLPDPPAALVLLIPQYHYRPWNVFGDHGQLQMIAYPVDALPPAPGSPPPALLRVTRALSDEGRLRILRFLAAGPQGFTAIVRFSGLAKSTVHHHLVILRAAGLVRVLVLQPGRGAGTYALRPGTVEALALQLGTFLDGEQAG